MTDALSAAPSGPPNTFATSFLMTACDSAVKMSPCFASLPRVLNQLRQRALMRVDLLRRRLFRQLGQRVLELLVKRDVLVDALEEAGERLARPR